MVKRKYETKTYVVEYIKELIKSRTDKDGKVDAKSLINVIDDAFPKKVIYIDKGEEIIGEK